MNVEADDQPLSVWIVDEGSPGHFSQSDGLVGALSRLVPINSVVINGRTKLRGWQRHLLRIMMGQTGYALPDRLLRLVAEYAPPSDALPPDLVVSSGGKSVFVGLSLAKRYRVPYVFIGERKPYPKSFFHTVVSPVPAESSSNTIDIELIPTGISLDYSVRDCQCDSKVWCMIIGGGSRSHQYTESDWISLAQHMNELSFRHQIRWRVSTSRRTGALVETILKQYLDDSVLVDAIWWAEEPRRELYKFIARSEVLYVTQDSVTMVTEAVASSRPVVVVSPQQVLFSDGSFLPDYFLRLEVNRRIIRSSINELGSVNPYTFKFDPIEGDLLQPVAIELLKRLH